MRKTSHLSVLCGAAVLLPASLLLNTGSVAIAASSYPSQLSAPYLEVDAASAVDMAADMKASGDKYYTLAFLIPKSGCTPEWEDNNDAVGAFNSQISTLQAAGGNVIISFGGESGGELAQTCTSATSLETAYANVVTTTNATRLDFDLEGTPLDDTASNARRDLALAALQKANSAVTVDYTLPVDPTGLEADSLSLLKDAKSKGVKVNAVNIMTMDFGNNQNPLTDAEAAANATHTQLESVFGITSAAAWHMLGLTPIAGKNDDKETFSQANAVTLETFAATNGVQLLSFWEVDAYDKSAGYAYSKDFNKI